MPVTARGNGFQAKFMLDGTRHVAQFGDKRAAEAWEAECRAAHARGQPIPAAHAGTTRSSRVADMGSLLQDTQQVWWKTRKSGDHLAMIASKYVEWVGPKTSVEEALTATKVDAYVRFRESVKRNSSATINRHLSAISVLIKHAVRLEILTKTIELPWQREGRGRLRYYEDHEVDAILATLETWGLGQYRGLFIFLVDTGARLGEAEKLQWRDIRGKAITFEDTKNGMSRTVTATPRVQEVLAGLAQDGSKGPFVWLNRDHLRRTWSRLRVHLPWLDGDDDAVVHTFRHTCASRLVQRGVDLYRVQRWMGHKNIATTMNYAHLAPKHMEELADVLAT